MPFEHARPQANYMHTKCCAIEIAKKSPPCTEKAFVFVIRNHTLDLKELSYTPTMEQSEREPELDCLAGTLKRTLEGGFTTEHEY